MYRNFPLECITQPAAVSRRACKVQAVASGLQLMLRHLASTDCSTLGAVTHNGCVVSVLLSGRHLVRCLLAATLFTEILIEELAATLVAAYDPASTLRYPE